MYKSYFSVCPQGLLFDLIYYQFLSSLSGGRCLDYWNLPLNFLRGNGWKKQDSLLD